MKPELLLQRESRRSGYPWDEDAESEIVRLNAGLERQLAECLGDVRKKTDQLRAMAAKLAEVEQCERGRMAVILHDNLQQLLVAARLQIGMVKNVLLPVTERNALFKANEIIGQAIADSRTLTVDLSPPIQHGADLGVALEWLARRMAELHGFTVELSIDRHAAPQTENLRVLLFEAVRELVFNSCKHSGCTGVQVKITPVPNGWVRVVVEDAGKGFNPAALNASMASGERLGLFSIQQRLADVGGQMTLTSEPGSGTRAEILSPIDLRNRIDNRRTAGRTDPEFRWDNETEDTLGVLVGSHHQSCVRPVPSSTLITGSRSLSDHGQGTPAR